MVLTMFGTDINTYKTDLYLKFMQVSGYNATRKRKYKDQRETTLPC